MSTAPSEDKVREFAMLNHITEAQARHMLAEHGHDEGRLAEAIKSLTHFLRAPS